MRKATKMKTLVAVLGLTAITLSAGLGALKTAKAEAPMPETDTFAPWGAQVRTQDPSGIRFITCVNTEWMEEQLAKGAQFGTIVAPASHYTGDLVHFAHPTGEDEFTVLDIKHTEESNWETVGDYTVLRAVLTDMPAQFYGTDILAKTYLYADLTDDGVENPTYTYAAGQSRSIAEVACIAIQNGENAKFLTDTFESTVQGISVSDTEMNLYVNYFGNVTAKPVFAEGLVSMPDAKDFPVVWTSSNQSVATVDENGKVVGVSAGTATLTATLGTYSKTVAVKVSEGTETGTSFEYGISNVFTSSSNTALRQASEYATDGKKTLALDAGNTYWPRLYIEKSYMDAIFADSTVNTFYFDVYNDGLKDHRVRPFDANAAAYPHFYGSTSMTVAITRTTYEAKKSANTNSYIIINFENGNSTDGVLENPFTLYFDNFRASTDNLDPNSTTYYTKDSASSLFATAYANGQLVAGSTYSAYEGVYSLRALFGTQKQWTGMTFRKGTNAGQLQAVFADPWVSGYSFYMYNPNSFDAYISFCKTSAYPTYDGTNFATESVKATKITAGQWTKVTLTRAMYESNLETGTNNILVMQLFAENTPANSYFYMDSFRAEYSYADPVGTAYYNGNSKTSTAIFSYVYGGTSAWAGGVASTSSGYNVYEGNYTLRTSMGANKSLGGLAFAQGTGRGQLRNVFADPSVKAYSFYMYNPNSFDAYIKFCRTEDYNSSDVNFARDVEGSTKIEAGKWTKVTLTREMYETLMDTTATENDVLVMKLFVETAPTAIAYFSIDSFHAEYS